MSIVIIIEVINFIQCLYQGASLNSSKALEIFSIF